MLRFCHNKYCCQSTAAFKDIYSIKRYLFTPQLAVGSLLCIRDSVAFLSELVDQEAKSLLLLWQEVIVIRLWQRAADTIHLGVLLVVMILEVVIHILLMGITSEYSPGSLTIHNRCVNTRVSLKMVPFSSSSKRDNAMLVSLSS